MIAASVANLMHLTLLINGSNTPAFLLSLTLPFNKSNPIHLNSFASGSVAVYEWWCKALNFATRSEASFAALLASTFGIIVIDSANSEIASYSLFPTVFE